MKAKLGTLSIGLALLTAGATGATAGGEWYRGAGSIKDYGGVGVPIPAPIPAPMYEPLWYFRADVSLAFGNSPDANETGMVFGEGNGTYRAASTFGVLPSWINDDFGQHAMYGAGAGYRWNDRIRTDITAESLRDLGVTIKGTTSDDLVKTGALTPGTYDVSVRDITSMRGLAFLANGYYDFAGWGALRPYVGGGLGFAVARVRRQNSTTETARETGVAAVVVTDVSSESAENQYVLAAAASAGVSYAFSEVTALDLSYRYLFIDGMDADLVVNGHGSRVSVDATSDHQFRAGLRFNIY